MRARGCPSRGGRTVLGRGSVVSSRTRRVVAARSGPGGRCRPRTRSGDPSSRRGGAPRPTRTPCHRKPAASRQRDATKRLLVVGPPQLPQVQRQVLRCVRHRDRLEGAGSNGIPVVTGVAVTIERLAAPRQPHVGLPPGAGVVGAFRKLPNALAVLVLVPADAQHRAAAAGDVLPEKTPWRAG